MERLGKTLESPLPVELRKRFAEGCQRSLKEGRLSPPKAAIAMRLTARFYFAAS
jgi:hypothetical protein